MPHNSEQMLSLVNDIEKYPEFLKWCKRGFIQDQHDLGYAAGLLISIKGVQVEFITENKIIHEENMTHMFMNLIDGPFKSMSGVWRFQQFPEFGSKVELQLQYEIKSKLINRVFARGFDQIAAHLVNDFVNRAGVIYAKS